MSTIYKNTASQKFACFAFNTNNNTPKTGSAATITATISKDGGAFSALADTNPDELGAGNYVFNLTQTETNADLLVISITSTDAGVSIRPITLYTSSASPDVNVVQLGGSATAANNAELFFDGTGYAGGTTKLDVNTVQLSGDSTAADNAELMFDGTGYAGGTTRLVVNPDYDALGDALADYPFDGITYASVMEMLIAFICGKVSVTDNGATRTISFKKRDGSTEKFSITASETDGSRSATGTII